jgi:hypothetical protein
VVPVPSRIIWTEALPRRATLNVDAAVPDTAGGSAVNVRLGISDDRVYELLTEKIITGRDSAEHGWTPLSADLSRYAGPKFSLFYRPDRHPWRIVLSVDTVDGGVSTAYLGQPGIDADVEAAKRFYKHHSVIAGSITR